MNRNRSWQLLIAGLPVLAIAGTWLFFSNPRRVVYTPPQNILSVTGIEPSPLWRDAVGRARRIVRTTVAEKKVPGLSIAVGAGDRIVWSEGFGHADLETRAPVTPNTRFRIGTASTALTSAGVGVLLEKGRLALDDGVQQHVPQFGNKQWPMTLRQAMSHVGGIGTDGGDEGPLLRVRCERPVEALKHFADDPLLFEPGTQLKYSKYGWILVSAAIEAEAHQPFLEFLRDQIFRPLEMNDTGAEPAKEENPEGIGEPGEDAPIFTLIRRWF